MQQFIQQLMLYELRPNSAIRKEKPENYNRLVQQLVQQLMQQLMQQLVQQLT